jgi:hypothetical protein
MTTGIQSAGTSLMIVEHLVDHGVPPTGVGWHVYR